MAFCNNLFVFMAIQANPLGLHQLLTLLVEDHKKLVQIEQFIDFTEELLEKYNLEKVGIASHVFDNKSYTVAFCLMESHICIHTWPENKNLALDIYLCNYSQDNTEKVRQLAKEYISFFGAEVLKQVEIDR